MKKRNLGRFAALGLAGLTSIPVVAISASANVTVEASLDGNPAKMKGTANYVQWSTTATTTKYTYTYTEGDSNYKKATATALIENIATKSATVTVDVNGSDGTGGTSFIGCDNVYYGYSNINIEDLQALKTAINQSKTANTKKEQDLEKLWKDYAAYNYADYRAKNSPKTRVSYTDLNGTTVYFYYEDGTRTIYQKSSGDDTVVSFTAPSQPSNEFTKVDFVVSESTQTNISMAALEKALGSADVKMNSSGIIVAKSDSTAIGSDWKEYKLNTSGNSSNGSGNTGNYGQWEIPSLYRYASNTSYYSYDTDTWYPNSSSFREAVGYYPNASYNGYWTSKTPAYKYSSSRRWFDPTDGNYYSANGGSAYTVLVSANYETDNTENYVYRSSTTGLYYLTWTAANNATNSNGTIEAIRSIPSYATFFSMSTGQFYSTYAAAYSASGNNAARVIALNGASASNTGLDYLDPFYYYYMNGTGLNRPTTDTSSVTIGNRKGWTNVAAYARSAKSGASYNVSMNGETVIPSTVLSAIKGKNVTMNFTLKNGVVYSINGNDVSSAKDLDIDTAYNTKNIPSKLVSKAKKKYDGVSTSQLSIDGGSFGSSAEMTVKFATKRAGCTARLYRYNADRNSLSLVSKSSVGSNGKCTFDDVTKGGDYVVVLS